MEKCQAGFLWKTERQHDNKFLKRKNHPGFTECFSFFPRDLIKKFLVIDRARRLGCMKVSLSDVMSFWTVLHPFSRLFDISSLKTETGRAETQHSDFTWFQSFTRRHFKDCVFELFLWFYASCRRECVGAWLTHIEIFKATLHGFLSSSILWKCFSDPVITSKHSKLRPILKTQFERTQETSWQNFCSSLFQICPQIDCRSS